MFSDGQEKIQLTTRSTRPHATKKVVRKIVKKREQKLSKIARIVLVLIVFFDLMMFDTFDCLMN